MVPIGQHLAELLGVPAVVAALAPTLVPTRQVPSPAWPGPIRLPALLNRGSYRAARYLTGAWCRRDIDAWRRADLGSGGRPGRHDPLGDPSVTVLHAFSPQVVPQPPTGPATAHITGYWFTREGADVVPAGGWPASSTPAIRRFTSVSAACRWTVRPRRRGRGHDDRTANGGTVHPSTR